MCVCMVVTFGVVQMFRKNGTVQLDYFRSPIKESDQTYGVNCSYFSSTSVALVECRPSTLRHHFFGPFLRAVGHAPVHSPIKRNLGETNPAVSI